MKYTSDGQSPKSNEAESSKQMPGSFAELGQEEGYESVDDVFEEAVRLWIGNGEYRGLSTDGARASKIAKEVGLLKAFALLLTDEAMQQITDLGE